MKIFVRFFNIEDLCSEISFFGCRAEYNPKNDLLDPEFMLKGKWYQRKDLEVCMI